VVRRALDSRRPRERKAMPKTPTPKPVVPTVPHAHYWLLPNYTGPTVKGPCKLCGKTREFPNQWNAELTKASWRTPAKRGKG